MEIPWRRLDTLKQRGSGEGGLSVTDCMQIIVGKFEGGEGEGIDDRLRGGIRRVTCVRTQKLRSHLSKEKT